MRHGQPSLPPGQAEGPHHRFGLPRFAPVRPVVPEYPVLWVGGTVRNPTQVDVATVASLPWRRDQSSDLHCATTWSVTGLHWAGVPFSAVHEFLANQVVPHPRCEWVVFTGLDGYRTCLRLDDAIADDVLLADTLDGQPLTPERGAPLRLAAPAHYGYKSVRHVCAVRYCRHYDPGSAGWIGHPRGRVGREERSRFLPGRVWRPIWRRAVPLLRGRYARFDT